MLLTIEIQEELQPYCAADLNRWRDPAWWAAEEWRQVLPEPEWHRVDKFRNQAAGGLVGYHFVEVLQMRALAEQGLSWLYENYDFFRPPGRMSKIFAPGYKVIADTFGEDKVHRIQELAKKYVPKPDNLPSTPDLFSYRKDGASASPVRFIEVKRDDAVSYLQLLGLALIQKVFETPVTIVRYVEPERLKERPATHRREFQAWR